MKYKLITVALLAIGVSAIYSLLTPPKNTVVKPQVVNQEDLNKVKLEKHSDNLSKTAIATKQSSSSHKHPTSQKENPAAQFNKLPQEMQKEIKSLSGRDNAVIQPIEIQPGVFIMPPNKGIKVVPVVVVNKDGSISTYEY